MTFTIARLSSTYAARGLLPRHNEVRSMTASTISADAFARYSLLTADEHYAMQGRAYRETVRSWAEARAATDLTLRGILTHSAIEADAFYQEVTLALSARTRPEMVRA